MNNILAVVGLGIKFKSHLTLETLSYIKEADFVFYLTTEPAMQEWIKKSNPNTESLEKFYNQFKRRTNCYEAMTKHVLHALNQNKNVCFALYGHPLLFAKPAVDLVNKAKLQGFHVEVLPGISAEDCLFADLRINPSQDGYHSYEATNFLIYKRKVDIYSHLILWQVGIIGVVTYPLKKNKKGLAALSNYLSLFYSPHHCVYIYEAAQYPHLEPKIRKVILNELIDASISTFSTLYIPPVSSADYDKEMLLALDLKMEDLKI